MATLAIIGGTGLADLSGFEKQNSKTVSTPYGSPSAPLLLGTFYNQNMIFLARHGANHTIAPHKVNYRANIWALKELGVTHILTVNAVGGIHSSMGPTHIVLPDQIIDYTFDRKHTFYEDSLDRVIHIDFTYPYNEKMRHLLIQKATELQNSDADFEFSAQGVYGCTQGPRLETKAEVDKLERDGCDVVGMTGMPEAALAAEFNLHYAAICLVVNKAAGRSDHLITGQDIIQALDMGMTRVIKLLNSSVADLTLL